MQGSHNKHDQRTDLPINRFRQGQPDKSNNWPDPINNYPEQDDAPAGPATVDDVAKENAHLKAIGKDPDAHLAKHKENQAAMAESRRALQEAVPEGDLASMAAEDHLRKGATHSKDGNPSPLSQERHSEQPRKETGSVAPQRGDAVPDTGREGPSSSKCVIS